MSAGFSIVELTELDDLRELAELFRLVWGIRGDPPIDSDVLKALAHSGNYISGGYAGRSLVGGLVGWFGGVPPHELHLHSHILGVLPGSDAHGLGYELKLHQRRWCLQRGLGLIEWTTDPLVRRNAYFNLTKLGARARGYLVNFYGEMRDGLNSGEESDRLLISWRLESESAEEAAAGRPAEPRLDQLVSAGAVKVLSVAPDGGPAVESPGMRASARVLLCQVPEDIVELRRHAAAHARSWRIALRECFTDALARGYEVSGATRSGWYVLEAPAE